MAASAGARRTHTAYTRFVTAQRAWDVTIANDQSFGVDPRQLTAIAALPGVRESVRGIVGYADLGVGVPFFAPIDGRVGTTINRFKLLEGRRPDDAHPHARDRDRAATARPGGAQDHRLRAPSGHEHGRVAGDHHGFHRAARRHAGRRRARLLGVDAARGPARRAGRRAQSGVTARRRSSRNTRCSARVSRATAGDSSRSTASSRRLTARPLVVNTSVFTRRCP